MKNCHVIFLALIQLAYTQKCNSYDFYQNDVKKFIKQCAQRKTLSFGTMSTPLIDAKHFSGHEFNTFFSKLRQFQVCIQIQNTTFKRVIFPAINKKFDVDCSKALSAIVIRDNPLLEEIIFGNGTASSKFVPPIMVRGNRKLSEESIANLNKIKRGVESKRTTVQAFGECSAPKPLTSLDDLVGCESVFGDIVLRGSTLLPPNKPLKPFNHIGCVVVKNSTVENIDFLSNMKAHMNPPWFCKNEILDNPNLCMHEEIVKHLNRHIANLNMTTVDYECEKVCMGGIVTPDYISSTIAGYQCAVIKGDVIIENWKGNTRALQHLKSIRKIIGVLRVLNNLDLVNLDFLAGLQEIDAGTTEQRAAVHVSNNSALRELQLVSLRSVKSNASKTIVIENNPLLSADINIWYELGGGKDRTTFIVDDSKDEESNGFTFVYVVIGIICITPMMLLIICWRCRATQKFSGTSTIVVTTTKAK